MAGPFSVQQNIQDLIGTQTTAQGAVPFNAQNGNPFTIYNQPLPQGGYLPPVTNAQDQWRVNPIPPAGPFDFTGWGSYNTAGPNMIPINWAQPPAPQAPPVTGGPGQQTPVNQPPAGGGGGGGGAGLTGGAGEFQNPWTTNQTYMNMWGSGASYPQSFSIYGIKPQDLQNPTYVSQGQMDSAAASNPALKDFFSGAVDGLKNKLGVGQGEISIAQILDLISEPLLPGNIWLAQEGKISTQNLVKALAQTVLGPLGKPLLALIGQVIPSIGKWLQQGKIDEALNALGAKIKREGLDDTAIGTQTVRTRGGNPWDGIGGLGGESGGGGCVVTTSRVPGFQNAGDIKVGDTMLTTDAVTFEEGADEVTYSKPELQPCVEITTESGIQLQCSTSAPIADKDGNQVKAPDLLDVVIPVYDHGERRFEKVVSVEKIGLRTVQKITCGNKFFKAGKESGRYVLHHNVKNAGFWDNRSFNWNTPGVVNVGPVENIK